MQLIIAMLLLPVVCSAQKQETTFYDWQWKPCDASLARFAGIVKKTDSGWLRTDYYLSDNSLQMIGLYKDDSCKVKNGRFAYYYANGRLSSQGSYVNNKKNGLWLQYHSNGMMKDSTVYADDMPTGISLSWHPNGYPSDSTFTDDAGNGVQVGWFDNGIVAAAGRLVKNKFIGKWVFYHRNGNKASEEIYNEPDKLQEAIYYTEEGIKTDKIVLQKSDADFAGGNAKWQKFLLKNLTFPAGYKLSNTNVVTVVITTLIDAEGNVTETYVDVPFKKPFDEEALRVIQKSPKWIPAVRHNRRVPMYIRQPISFAQNE